MRGFLLPSRDAVRDITSFEIPAHIGADRLVPPTTLSVGASVPQDEPLMHLPSSKKKTPGRSGLAIIATSGTARIGPLGPPATAWNAGLKNTPLTPPPPAPPSRSESFHTDSATDPTSLPLPSKTGK